MLQRFKYVTNHLSTYNGKRLCTPKMLKYLYIWDIDSKQAIPIRKIKYYLSFLIQTVFDKNKVLYYHRNIYGAIFLKRKECHAMKLNMEI